MIVEIEAEATPSIEESIFNFSADQDSRDSRIAMATLISIYPGTGDLSFAEQF